MTPEQLTAAKVLMVHGPMLLVIVLLAIVFIIVATAKFKLHPFFTLLLAAYGVAFAVNMPTQFVGNVIAQGFQYHDQHRTGHRSRHHRWYNFGTFRGGPENGRGHLGMGWNETFSAGNEYYRLYYQYSGILRLRIRDFNPLE